LGLGKGFPEGEREEEVAWLLVGLSCGSCSVGGDNDNSVFLFGLSLGNEEDDLGSEEGLEEGEGGLMRAAVDWKVREL
jgi:hypothetical protein